MPRVHCLQCDAAVIIDPRGVCPEGHHVGAPGDRVDQFLGTATPHHDEPEPWVFRIDDAAPRSGAVPVGAGVGAGVGAAARNGHQAGTGITTPMRPPARPARPIAAPDGDDGPFDRRRDPQGREASESLLGELRSLAAFEAAVAPPEQPAAVTPPQPPAAGPPPPPPEALTPPPLPDDGGAAMADAFAELSSLDTTAPVRPVPDPAVPEPAAADPEPASALPPVPGPNGADHLDDHVQVDDLGEFAGLFAEMEPSAGEPSPLDSAAAELFGTGQDAPSGAAAPVPDAASADPGPPAAPAPDLDLSSFTARGASTKGGGGTKGRRRLFGR